MSELLGANLKAHMRLFKKVQAAYDYFPYEFPTLRSFGVWIYGPTFAAKVLDREDVVISVWMGFGAVQVISTQNELQSILATTDLHDVKVDPNKHSDKCSGRTLISGIFEKVEMPWVHWDLARALGAKKFKQSAMIIYGYTDDDECQFVGTARYQTDACFKPREKS